MQPDFPDPALTFGPKRADNYLMTPSFSSRAVTRQVEAGCSAICAVCNTQVKFTAKVRRWQVIANVYVDGVWDRVEHYHGECYEAAGRPYGPATAPLSRSA